MDGYVDRAIKLRLIEFLGEKPFAPDFAQGAILDHVATGLDDDDFEMLFESAMNQREAAARLMRLRQRQWAAARANFQQGRQNSAPRTF
jgi:hypothetical protein